MWSRAATSWSPDGVFGGEGLIAPGRQNVWVCQLGREKVDGPFKDWTAKIAAAPVKSSDSTVTYTAPGIGTIDFGWEGAFRVDGKVVTPG